MVVTLGVVLSFLEVRSGLVTSRLAPALAETLSKATTPATAQPVKEPAVGEVEVATEPVVTEPATQQVVNHHHSITVSATSLQVTSAITGVIILVISLGFLYLFVDKVLELKPVDLITQNAPTVPPTPDAPAPPATE